MELIKRKHVTLHRISINQSSSSSSS